MTALVGALVRVTSVVLSWTIVASMAVVLGAVFAAEPASAAYYWRQVQHNIKGSADGHDGDPGYAEYFIDRVLTWRPIAASANEVCFAQADLIWNRLKDYYAIWFVRAHDNIPNCGWYGNVLLVNRDATYTRDDSKKAYQSTVVSTPYTKVFSHQPDTNPPIERRRVDCAYITGGTSAPTKFSVCTLHLSPNSGDSSMQMNDMRTDPSMGGIRMFMGDFNLESGYMANNVSDWRWDSTESPVEPTSDNGAKIDWVLGRTDAEFTRVYQSNPQLYGDDPDYQSDHKLLLSWISAEPPAS